MEREKLDFEIEEWRDIKQYEGLYQVSNLGRVRSRFKVLKTFDNGNGYLKVVIRKKNHYVHRLVADAFIQNSFNKNEVNHKDMDRGNNRADNLEWTPSSENKLHAIGNGGYAKQVKGEKHKLCTLSDLDVLEIYKLKNSGLTMREVSKKFNCSYTNVWHIWHKKTRKYLFNS